MRLVCFLFLGLVSLPSFAEGGGFQECFDHGNGGAAPAGAPVLYKIEKHGGNPYLVASARKTGLPVFKLIIEDVRFTTYKCWDKNGNLTGFDIEMMAQAAYDAGYRQIEFVLRPWTDVVIDGKKQLSLLADLNNGHGDAVSAGMSITPERRELAEMVGPIYKAGKKLMARKDNPRIDANKLSRLLGVPERGFSSLAGLSVVVMASDIRGAYFRKLQEVEPGLVEYMQLDASGRKVLPVADEQNKLSVLEISDFSLINGFIDSQMNGEIFGKKFDLVMIDTGSSKSLIEEGKLGVETQVVTGNLSADPATGVVFGTGDGVSFRKGDSARIAAFRSSLGAMVRSGRIDALVTKWFQDENAADHGWAK